MSAKAMLEAVQFLIPHFTPTVFDDPVMVVE
jgi:hypothetical protein